MRTGELSFPHVHYLIKVFRSFEVFYIKFFDWLPKF